MKFPRHPLVLFLLSNAAPAFAVDEIRLEQDPAKPKKVGDTFCIAGTEGRSRCGKVTKADEKTALVQLNVISQGIDFLSGDEPLENKPAPRQASKKPKVKKVETPTPSVPIGVALPPQEPPREPSSITIEAPLAKVSGPWSIGAGLGMGTDYLFPMVHLERSFSTYGFGIMPFYSSGGGANVAGAFLTSHFALGDDDNHGFVLQENLGYYDISASVASGASVAFTSLLTWRAQTTDGLFFQGGAGMQYTLRVRGSAGQINFSGFQSQVLLEVGKRF